MLFFVCKTYLRIWMYVYVGKSQPPTSEPPSSHSFVSVSVGELVQSISTTLRAKYSKVRVRGEAIGVKTAASGHTYFDLKDGEGMLSCLMFAGVAASRAAGGRLKEGTEYEVRGDLDVYAPRGQMRIRVSGFEAVGEGEEEEKKEKLLNVLKREGMLNRKRRPLPLFPTHLCVVTSVGSAAYHDIRSGILNRWPALRVTYLDARVQGAEAEESLLSALEEAERRREEEGWDVLVLARGGGSKEDLSAFCGERVVRAVAGSSLVTVSAVGHESDTVLTDMVCDKRAKTPTAAIEMAVPSVEELRAALKGRRGELEGLLRRRIGEERRSVRRKGEGLETCLRSKIRTERERLTRREPGEALRACVREGRRRLEARREGLERGWEGAVREGRRRLEAYEERLDALDPWNTMKRGFAYVVAVEEDGEEGEGEKGGGRRRMVRTAEEWRREREGGKGGQKRMKLVFWDGEVSMFN